MGLKEILCKQIRLMPVLVISTDDNTGKNESAPMSVEFSIFGLKPPNRPTINRYNSIGCLINSKWPNSL